MPTWGSPDSRCSTRSVTSADACARAMGGAAAANFPLRIFGEAHPADDDLRPGDRSARILPVIRGNDRRGTRIRHRGVDRGACPHDGHGAVWSCRARGKSAELHAGSVRNTPWTLDWTRGVWT